MFTRLSRCRACVCLLIAALGCTSAYGQTGRSQESSEFYELAAQAFAVGDYKTAIIELKNAVRSNPGNAPARALLGRAYLNSGQASAAEKELTMALYYGADEALVLVPLGNAMLLQRKHEEILKLVRSRDLTSRANAGVLSIRGQAHLELGQIDAAESDFRDASWLTPTKAEPLLGLADVVLLRGDPAQAERIVDDAGRLEPDNEEVWFRKGQLRAMAGDPQQALALFDRTLSRAPAHMRSRMARAKLHIERGDYEAARTDADKVLSLVPNDAYAALISAQANARLGAGANASEAFNLAVQRIAEIDPEFLWRSPSALALAGKISFVQRDFEKVNLYLTRYLGLQPGRSPTIRRLLGRARLEIGNAKGAVSALEPLMRETPDDAESLTLLGDAYLRAGMFHQATTVFERAATLTATDGRLRTRLAMSRLGTGRTLDALSALEEAFELDTGSMRAGLLLTFIHIRRGELDAAARTAAALKARFPDNPVTENLLGVVRRGVGDPAAARTAFTRALELDADFEPAAFNLAELELAAGNRDTARAQYQRILERNPRSARALVGLSDFAQAEGRIFDAISLLDKAVTLAPDAVQPYQRLIAHHLSLNRTEDALRTALAIADRHPENASVQLELARTQIATRQYQPAIQTLRNATRYAGYSGQLLLSIGRMQSSVSDYEGATWSFQKALETGQRDAANAALVRLQITTGDLAAALTLADALRTKDAANPIGHMLAGEVLARQGSLDEAIGAYEKALSLADRSEAMIGLFETLVTAGQRERAFERLEQWLQKHPGDLRAKRALGLGYIAFGRLDRAEKIHDELLKELPRDPLIYNNLARMYQLKNDPRSRDFAQRAVDMAPAWAIALDTLGWIMVTEGDAAKGLPLLRDANARESGNALIRYHMAGALSELGRKQEALAELDFILREQPKLSWIKDVQALRDEVAKQ